MAGKGDRQRPTGKQYGSNFDQIDWSKKDEKRGTDNDRQLPGNKTKATGGDK